MRLKLLLAALLLLMPIQARADIINDVISKSPPLHSGIAYSTRGHGVNHTETFTAVTFGKYVNLDGGYAGDSDNPDHELVVGVSANLVENGFIKFPVLQYIEFKPQLLVGLGHINLQGLDSSKLDFLIGAQLINWKF